jgi:glutamate synthase (NADPH/NADH) small chain
MDFLTQQNRRVAGDAVPAEGAILATGKRVVVIGGGDTGSDCVGTSIRQGALSVLQLELMPKPNLVRRPENPWPEWPLVLRTSSSHEEGAERQWSIRTESFVGADSLRGIAPVRADTNDAVSIPCELALLAMGFTGPETIGLVQELGLELDGRGNVRTDAAGRTSRAKVFAAGDVSRGQSLVVWAIADGRRVARGVHGSLMPQARVPSERPSAHSVTS